ncbi:Serine/threonine-protein kinase plk2 [Linnemannia zychae]|nr:Serine/threonine-protein kinase plk2 [Linnemannia zychae]
MNPSKSNATPTPRRTRARQFLFGAVWRQVFFDPRTLRVLVGLREAPLGEGTFGYVYDVVDDEGYHRALKVPKDPSERAQIKKEAKFLSRVQGHKNVVEFFGRFDNVQGLCLEFALYESYDFEQLLMAKAPLPEDQVKMYGRQLAAGLAHIHSTGLIHCDVKPENMLVAGGSHLRITDFGLAESTRSLPTSWDRRGTPGYWAPEVVRKEAHTVALDVFSLGVVLYNMVTKRMPHLTDLTGAYEPEEDYLDDIPCSGEVKAILYACLAFDVSKRPRARELVRCKFFHSGPKQKTAITVPPVAVAAAHTPSPAVAPVVEKRKASAEPTPDARGEGKGKAVATLHDKGQDQGQKELSRHVRVVKIFKAKKVAREAEWAAAERRILLEREQLVAEEKAIRELAALFGTNYDDILSEAEE